MSKLSWNFKAWAEKSKREPKHQSDSQNIEMQAKLVDYEQKQWNVSIDGKTQAKTVKRGLKHCKL